MAFIQLEHHKELYIFIHDHSTGASLVAWRATLRQLFTKLSQRQTLLPADLADVNALLAQIAFQVQVSVAGTVKQEAIWHGAPAEAGLLPLALSALDLLTSANPERIRACENPHCLGIFLDISKSGNRRWCCEACMNRARSSRRYARARH